MSVWVSSLVPGKNDSGRRFGRRTTAGSGRARRRVGATASLESPRAMSETRTDWRGNLPTDAPFHPTWLSTTSVAIEPASIRHTWISSRRAKMSDVRTRVVATFTGRRKRRIASMDTRFPRPTHRSARTDGASARPADASAGGRIRRSEGEDSEIKCRAPFTPKRLFVSLVPDHFLSSRYEFVPKLCVPDKPQRLIAHLLP